MNELRLSDMAQMCAVQNAVLSVVDECVYLATKMGAKIFHLSNGWFLVTRGSNEVYYDRFSELHSDLTSGMLNDYLMSVV